MQARKLIDVLTVASRLKDTTRHCYTAHRRHESVAEYSWLMTIMAFFMKDEFPDVDMGVHLDKDTTPIPRWLLLNRYSRRAG